MKASINVVCYKWKVLANGECPLMLRVAKDKKRTMKSLGISVNPLSYLLALEHMVPAGTFTISDNSSAVSATANGS